MKYEDERANTQDILYPNNPNAKIIYKTGYYDAISKAFQAIDNMKYKDIAEFDFLKRIKKHLYIEFDISDKEEILIIENIK